MGTLYKILIYIPEIQMELKLTLKISFNFNPGQRNDFNGFRKQQPVLHEREEDIINIKHITNIETAKWNQSQH